MLNDPSLVCVVLCGPSRLKAPRAVLAASSASKHLGPVLRNLRLVEAAMEVTGLEGLGSTGHWGVRGSPGVIFSYGTSPALSSERDLCFRCCSWGEPAKKEQDKNHM